ncbi:MAG: hypothetical protein EBS23_00790 [Betaproteobacteria bacterium]|nr:hypothetical protein [Betaproteobacteria bacterium]
MIVARIDNARSSRTPFRRGRSFKGALKYLLTGSKTAPSPERVLYAETVNIYGDLSDAAHAMATTWQARFALMRAAGLAPKNGADNKAPVYHLVISWSADEDPPPSREMADLAKQLLCLLGLGEHEAVLVVHGDTDHPHIHIIANTVHPVTGRTAPLSFDNRIMQGFAARYEELRGKIVCTGRFAPEVRSAFNAAAGLTARGRRQSRPRWHRSTAPVREAARIALPSVVLEALTRHNATFSAAELARAVTETTATPGAFADLMAAVMASPELVRLTDAEGAPRYTTRTQLDAEARLAASAAHLATTITHDVTTVARTRALSRFAGPEQSGPREALAHLLDPRGLSAVVGYAGAGKSTLLKAAAEAWHASGYRLRGLALAGRAAEALEADSGIPSGTIAGFLMGLDSGAVVLGAKDIIVIDEAGMVASRQLDRLLFAVRQAGAKVVLVGDPEQLQAIEAGGPFRYIVEHFEHARLTTIWRQKEAWMREATRNLAEGATQLALTAYTNAGMVQAHDAKADAITSILDMWLANRERGLSQLILTATNADAGLVNTAARGRLKEMGVLGPDTVVDLEEGPMAVAAGDRIVFRRNDRTLGVKNGTTGTLVTVAGQGLVVAVDGPPPRLVEVDTARYPHIAHGYAVTIHKAQGATVDRTYVLAAPNMDRHSAYVALSRHRERVSLHWSKDVFPDVAILARRLARKRLKDTTLDYREEVAAKLRTVTAKARAATATMPDTKAWAGFLAAQRAEADHVAGMSTLRRTFWMAAHLDRFVRARAVTLAGLQTRERAAFAAMLRKAPVGDAQPGACPTARPSGIEPAAPRRPSLPRGPAPRTP